MYIGVIQNEILRLRVRLLISLQNAGNNEIMSIVDEMREAKLIV